MDRGGAALIRPATRADRDQLGALHRAAYAVLSGDLYGDRDAAWEQGFFAARLAHPVDIEVAVASGTVIGAVYVEQRADEVRVESLEVLPARQRRGVGSALLGRVLGRAGERGAPVSLRVHRGNPRARWLYERLGFQVVREDGSHFEMRWSASRGL
ncbi:GNAT family N-acetyltransferase [Schaalia naturae]|uniref:GNAT family N-acetyltransferase n=1 Tax=Schaalia naturae TaxID=635203 RepID=A0ABW2SPY5_9ACTO